MQLQNLEAERLPTQQPLKVVGLCQKKNKRYRRERVTQKGCEPRMSEVRDYP